MKQIHQGIFQLVTPFPEFSRDEAYRLRNEMERHPRVTRNLPYVLSYAVASRGEVLLVDCGWNTEEAFAALNEEFQESGLRLGDLKQLAITHGHADHCGLAGRLQEETGCQVWMHERDSVHLATDGAGERWQDESDRWLEEHGVPVESVADFRWHGGVPDLFLNSFGIDRPLAGGEVLTIGELAFEIVWTPGHSPGHICLYEPNHALLLTGDHVLPTITPNVSVDPDNPGNPLKDFLLGLERVAALKVDRMLPAHEWDISWFQRRVKEIIDHHEERLEQVLAAVGEQEALSAVAVAERLPWATGSYDTFSPGMKRAAIGEALSHLVYLASEGHLTQISAGDRTLFQGP